LRGIAKHSEEEKKKIIGKKRQESGLGFNKRKRRINAQVQIALTVKRWK